MGRGTPRGHLSRVAAGALTLLAGCGGEPSGGPPEIQYGLEECDYCRMIISQEKSAAAIVDEAGAATPFDDLGCLLDYLRDHRSVRPPLGAPSAGPPPGESSVGPPPGELATATKVWVHDHADVGWIAAEPAWFVRDPRGLTPMGSGLRAFAMRPDAEAFAGDRGWQVMAWPELLERPSRERPGSPAPPAEPE